MAEHDPDVLRDIVEADRVSRERRGGHGNALAQVYNHMIMPLAGERDKRTQVLWGIADFRHRFGRERRGDVAGRDRPSTPPSLEALAEAGVKFTILSPYQARRWRKLGGKEWVEIPGGIDPSRAYAARLPSGRSIALFFYDGNISRQVAFERLLDDGERFLQPALDGLQRRPRPRRSSCTSPPTASRTATTTPTATWRWRTSSDRLADDPEVQLTNYGEFLELHPPEWEVEIHENSAWSCATASAAGAPTAAARCAATGTRSGAGRSARRSTGSRRELDHLFGTRGRECFPDPWAARDGYIDVVLDREPGAVDAVPRRPRPPRPRRRPGPRRPAAAGDAARRHVDVHQLRLVLRRDQRPRDDPVPALRRAGRSTWPGSSSRDFEPKFLADPGRRPRATSRSSATAGGSGSSSIRPATVDLDRVLAHYGDQPDLPARATADERPYPFDLEILDEEVRSRGASHLAVGRLCAPVAPDLGRGARPTSSSSITAGSTSTPSSGPPPTPSLTTTSSAGSSRPTGRLAGRRHGAGHPRLPGPASTGSTTSSPTSSGGSSGSSCRTGSRTTSARSSASPARTTTSCTGSASSASRSPSRSRPPPRRTSTSGSASELERLEQDGGLESIGDLYGRGRAWGYQPETALLEKVLSEALRRTLRALDPSADLPAPGRPGRRLLDAAALLGDLRRPLGGPEPVARRLRPALRRRTR